MQGLKSVTANNQLSLVPPGNAAFNQASTTDLIGSIESLKEMVQAMALMIEVARESKEIELEYSNDFYRSVRRFEVGMIKRALEITGGQQRKAAQLLGIKVTTLNSKIKRFKI